MKKLAIVSTHAIQYNAPLFRRLAARPGIELKVFYTRSEHRRQVADREFGRTISWDIPLLEGYEYQWEENISRRQFGSFFSVINPDLIRDLEAFSPDAIWVFGWNHYSHFKVMRYFKGRIPIWFRGDSTLQERRSWWRKRLRLAVLRRVYRHVDLAFYVGSENRRYYAACGLSPEQLVFAPHAIDNERFMLDSEEREKAAAEWRRQLGFADSELVILYAGKFTSGKCVVPLLNEYLRHRRGRPDSVLRLLLVGNGSREDELRSLGGVDAGVVFLPFQNQSIMPLVYRLADVMILPTASDSWGLVVNEAMACCRAVIVARQAGCACDLVRSGNFIFDSEDPAGLQDIFRQLNREDLKKAGTNNRLFISNWNYDSVIRAVESRL